MGDYVLLSLLSAYHFCVYCLFSDINIVLSYMYMYVYVYISDK